MNKERSFFLTCVFRTFRALRMLGLTLIPVLPGMTAFLMAHNPQPGFEARPASSPLMTSLLPGFLWTSTTANANKLETAEPPTKQEEEQSPVLSKSSPSRKIRQKIPRFGLRNFDPSLNHIPIANHRPSFATAALTLNDVLKDKDDRIARSFKITPDLEQRVKFWSQIYSTYSSHFYLIHDTDRPWITYQVLDNRDLFKDLDRPVWRRIASARQKADLAKKKVRAQLKRIASKRRLSQLSPSEREMASLFPGKFPKNRRLIRKAARNVRAQLGQKDYFYQALYRFYPYKDEIEQLFKEHKLPVELARLSFVESSFNPRAISKVGASGVWQIMPSIGKKLLRLDPHIDERNSPLKATRAAIYLFKENKVILKDWALAVSAYNHGPGLVKRAIRQTKERALAKIIEKYSSPNFGFASQNFYSSFLAALHTERYASEIFGAIHGRDLEFVPVTITRKVRARQVLEHIGIDDDLFLYFNLDFRHALRKNSVLPAKLKFYLPHQLLAGLKSAPSLFEYKMNGRQIAARSIEGRPSKY